MRKIAGKGRCAKTPPVPRPSRARGMQRPLFHFVGVIMSSSVIPLSESYLCNTLRGKDSILEIVEATNSSTKTGRAQT